MRKLVLNWILIGSLGFFILPWYVVDDGLLSLEWLLYYSFEDYGSGFIVSLFYNRFWILPIVAPLLAPLTLLFIKTSNRIYSNVFLISGLIGIIYFSFKVLLLE